MRIKKAAAAGGTLDAYTTGLWGAWSVDKLLSSYSGAGITLYKVTGGTTQDINFAGSTLDSSAISSFLSGSDGKVSEWKNQQGDSTRRLAQGYASINAYPLIATAGSYNGKVAFDGSSDMLSTDLAVSGSVNAFTIFFRGKQRNTTGFQILLEHSVNSDSSFNKAGRIDNNAGTFRLVVRSANPDPTGYVVNNYVGLAPNDDVSCWKLDRTQVTSAAMAKYYIGGVLQTRSSDGSFNGFPQIPFTAQPWYLGARQDQTSWAAIDVHTLLIYEAALSDADITAISTIIAALP